MVQVSTADAPGAKGEAQGEHGAPAVDARLGPEIPELPPAERHAFVVESELGVGTTWGDERCLAGAAEPQHLEFVGRGEADLVVHLVVADVPAPAI